MDFCWKCTICARGYPPMSAKSANTFWAFNNEFIPDFLITSCLLFINNMINTISSFGFMAVFLKRRTLKLASVGTAILLLLLIILFFRNIVTENVLSSVRPIFDRYCLLKLGTNYWAIKNVCLISIIFIGINSCALQMRNSNTRMKNHDWIGSKQFPEKKS